MITIVSYILGFSGYMSRIPNGNANGQATGHRGVVILLHVLLFDGNLGMQVINGH